LFIPTLEVGSNGAVAGQLYYDRPRWFWKAYYDPYVNFTHQNMVRVGIGLKF
jgi:hypothetical protein